MPISKKMFDRTRRPVMGINPVRRLQKGRGVCTSRPSNKILPQHAINRENSRIREDLADRQLLQEMQAIKMKALLEELEAIPIGQYGEIQKEILQEIADLRQSEGAKIADEEQKGNGGCFSRPSNRIEPQQVVDDLAREQKQSNRAIDARRERKLQDKVAQKRINDRAHNVLMRENPGPAIPINEFDTDVFDLNIGDLFEQKGNGSVFGRPRIAPLPINLKERRIVTLEVELDGWRSLVESGAVVDPRRPRAIIAEIRRLRRALVEEENADTDDESFELDIEGGGKKKRKKPFVVMSSSDILTQATGIYNRWLNEQITGAQAVNGLTPLLNRAIASGDVNLIAEINRMLSLTVDDDSDVF